MPVVHVKTVDEYRNLLETKDKLIVVDFSASWCGPCKSIAPFYEKLSDEHQDVLFLHVDVDELSSLDEVSNIQGVPTFVFYKNGSELKRFSGASQAKLTEHVQSLK